MLYGSKLFPFLIEKFICKYKKCSIMHYLYLLPFTSKCLERLIKQTLIFGCSLASLDGGGGGGQKVFPLLTPYNVYLFKTSYPQKQASLKVSLFHPLSLSLSPFIYLSRYQTSSSLRPHHIYVLPLLPVFFSYRNITILNQYVFFFPIFLTYCPHVFCIATCSNI